MDVLRVLDNEIAARCAATLEQQADWPCRRGCDHCCRHLSKEPQLTRAEYERMEPLLTEAMRGRALQVAGPPYVCPLLEEGACGVYGVRPIACRTYGFYAERDKGLYCGQIAERNLSEVVWGNQVAVDRRLDELGARRPLSEWIAHRIDRR